MARVRFRSVLVGITVLAMLLSGLSDAADARRGHNNKNKKNKKNNSNTTLTIDSASESSVSGDISSKKGSCVADRVVFVTLDGNEIGSDTTDADGSWSTSTGGTALISGDEVVAKVEKIKAKKGKKGDKKDNKKGKKKEKNKNRNCGAASDTFVVVTQLMNVNVDGPGEVDSNGSGPNGNGIFDCRDTTGDCSENFANGQTVSLTASPIDGSTFTGWSGNAGSCAGTTTNPCSVVMDQPRNITATFTAGGAACPLDPIPTLGPILCGLA